MTERIPAIQKALAAVENALEALTEKVSFDEAMLRRVKRTAIVAAIGVVLDITLTVLITWGLAGVSNNQARINQLQAALQSETDRNRTAQCAMVALFLQFEPRTLSNPTYTEEQRDQQKQAYATLRGIAHDLQCPE